MAINTFEFPNGFRLVHKQERGSLVHLGIIVRVGSRDEDERQQGIAHLIEHLIFKGTAKRSNVEILNRVENVGADLNAFTTKEETCIYASLQYKYFDRAAELLSDIFLNATFPEKEVEKEKAVIIDEINSYKENPSDWIHEEFDTLLFKDHPLGRSIMGTRASLKRFSRKEIIGFRDTHYLPSVTIISSVSSLPFAKVVAVIEKHFASVPGMNYLGERLPFSSYNPGNITKKFSRQQAHCIIGNIACDAHDENRTTMVLLNNILGGPAMNSRLNFNLREKNGIAYNIESNYQAFSDTGMFSIYCGTDDIFMPQAIDLILRELRKLQEKPLSSSALHIAQQQLKGQIALSLESHQADMLSMGRSMLLYNHVETVEEIYNKIDAVTTEQLRDVANEVFDGGKLSMLIYNRNSK